MKTWGTTLRDIEHLVDVPELVVHGTFKSRSDLQQLVIFAKKQGHWELIDRTLKDTF